ncbi:MAG: DNA replication/repair protein RecF [Streptococcaceae bacterium]|nr:DNA replication/repair protein RecF [Streptococcaceae bacterium]
MFIKEIVIKNFRNYKDIHLQFHEKMNLILGENAQGKTNLLEAIYLTSFGKSFRTSKDSEMIRFDEEFCKVKVTFDCNDDKKNVDIIIGKEKKAVKIDDLKIKKISELMNQIFIVIFSPEDLKIVKEDPEKRRKFIDRELCQIKPSYFANLSSYKRILMQRNAFLKEKKIDHDFIDIWDEKLILFGSKIIAERQKFIDKMNHISNEIHQRITNGKENLEIVYESNVPYCEDIQEQLKLFQFKIKETFKKDMIKGYTGTGPHRDDLKICVNGIDIRTFGSQGQQRTAALSLKLAELTLIEEETGEKAILLLDDVLSELDHERQKFLINSLSQVQLFIATTEIDKQVLNALTKGFTFTIKEGTVKKSL